jgi:hypothetical protein
MDSHQGAGFAFDMNMDFSNVFAPKSNEGETSNNFFGDEGIDTTTSFGQQFDPLHADMFSTTSHEQTFVLPQNLVHDPLPLLRAQVMDVADRSQSMDNTSGSTSVWNGQLTPEMQNTLNTFPPTPTHSFDSMYQPSFNTLGKRPLQLDVQDFPQSKRHESVTDYTTASLFSPMPSTSWAVDAQLTPAASVEVGLSDEAADMCAMWFNKYAILPR